ncbi:MAG: hypothetical protein COA45_08570 [Zetaproteobacteria bacterium]|nr:MAG: hypothetical protein COA45_08570 [Zetaproteobacteria bacterium]
MSAQRKREAMLSYAMQDKFFAEVTHNLVDFGHEINFSLRGGAGAYQPFSLSTEKIDTPEKQQQFSSGFWDMVEQGNISAKLCFSMLSSADVNAHYFLHELMHFYQDMHGLYLLPIHEQGVFPILLDAKSDIVAILFCEAWAEVEAIRTSWALRESGHPSGWNGAMASADWRGLACAYDDDLNSGVDEAKAAANTFHRWYEGKHRRFYENHALRIHEINLARFKEGVENINEADLTQNFRALELPMLIARIPKGGIPKFFHQIDWESDVYAQVSTPDVCARVQILEDVYGVDDNPNIQDIKCGAPPYLWHRLHAAQKAASEVLPQ